MNLMIQWQELIQGYWTIEFFQQTMLAIGVMLVVLLLNRWVSDKLIHGGQRLVRRSKATWGDTLFESMALPLKRLIRWIAYYFFLVLFPITAPYADFWNGILRSLVIVSAGLVLAAMSEEFAKGMFVRLKEEEVRQTVLPLVVKSFKVVIFALSLLMVIQEWGYDVKGFIAGLGLAGFAVAMGAQDTITNLMSGVFLIVDRTVSVGDWIQTDQVEGIVEEMSFRTTRIRTFEQALITVPNSSLANRPVINNTKRGMRRIRFDLGVMYKTSAQQLERVVKSIEAMLYEHPRVVNDTVFVRFMEFGDSSLNIMVSAFGDTTAYEEFINIRQEINFRIMDILEAEGVSAAFPSTSVYIEKSESELSQP